MLVIPAIDIRDGKCVRLFQGDYGKETVYSDDPVNVAKNWEKNGAKRLHIVDLDGAFEGKPKNIEIVKEIRKAVKIQLEFGGGVRSSETLEMLFGAGIDHVILGTAAVSNPDLLNKAIERYKQKLIVGVDVRMGMVAVSGWTQTTNQGMMSFVKSMKMLGVEQILFTDISKDGAMKGPNLEALKEIARESGLKVIASGGVSTLEDIKNIKQLEAYGVNGIIIGKALYTGDIKLEDAIELCR
jgi:phosphoribosylformimino-5-aminoimidazole carboxamide ribotide isomerase